MSKIESNALFKISYGLFVLTAKDGEKDNGCIINTVMQITSEPQRITVCVNKSNFTHDMILKTGVFNVSVLTEQTPFSVFEHFGFQSGRDVNKFRDCIEENRSDNGVLYIKKYANAFLSGKVISATDYGTHTEFVAEITEAQILSDLPSATYQYYFDNIKPKPEQKKKKGFICKICGYVYEGDELPEDFICPICKHPASDFEPLV